MGGCAGWFGPGHPFHCGPMEEMMLDDVIAEREESELCQWKRIPEYPKAFSPATEQSPATPGPGVSQAQPQPVLCTRGRGAIRGQGDTVRLGVLESQMTVDVHPVRAASSAVNGYRASGSN